MKSFATQTRDSITREDTTRSSRPCCMQAELFGFVFACAVISFTGGGSIRLTLRLTHAGTVRRMVKRLRSFGIVPDIRIIQAKRLGGQTCFEIRLDHASTQKLLPAIGYEPNASVIPPQHIKKKCCKQALLRGAFLGCGTLVDPQNSYLVEFILQGEQTAQALLHLIWSCFGIRVGLSERKGNHVIYCKDSEGIIRILSQIGAYNAICEIENIRIYKDARNKANRAYNCDNANIKKVVSASERQIEAITTIERAIGLGSLPETLRDIARVRMDNPGATLADIGQMLLPPVGKSGVQHRLRRIEEIAQAMQSQQMHAQKYNPNSNKQEVPP